MSIAEDLTGQTRPAPPDEKGKERLRTLTVEVLLGLRSAYLASPGANALKMREMLPNRSRAALRTTQSPQEWHTRLVRNLQIGDIDKYRKNSSGSRALIDLVDYVEGNDARMAWREMMRSEEMYIFSLVWVTAEERKAAKLAEEGSE